MSESQDLQTDQEPVLADPAEPFVAPVAVEQELPFLFDGDRGQLPYDARRALTMLLARRFIEAADNPLVWQSILLHQDTLESRFHDMFLELVVDRNYEIAYKVQLREDGLNIPILIKDESYRRVETLLLVNLRNTFRQQMTMGETAAFVDGEDLIEFALSFISPEETNLASRKSEAQTALAQLAREGIVREVESGRFRISPVIEVLLPIERLQELTAWLQENHGLTQNEDADV